MTGITQQINNHKYLIIIAISLFLLSFLVSKYYYFYPYREILGDRMSDDYYSILQYYGGDLRNDIEKMLEGEIDNEEEFLDIKIKTYNKVFKIQDINNDYNYIKNSRGRSRRGRELIEFTRDYRSRTGFHFNAEEGKVNIRNRKMLEKCLYVARGLEEIVYRHYPVMKENDYTKKDVVEEGHSFWNNEKWEEVFIEMDDYIWKNFI